MPEKEEVMSNEFSNTNLNNNKAIQNKAIQTEQQKEEIDAYMSIKCDTIGKNVRYERKKRGFSIDNLAEYAELSPSYVGLLERGDRCPSLKSLFKLCDLFDISPDELLIESRDNGQKLLVAEEKSTKIKNNHDAVISLLHGLDNSELEFVATAIKGLRKLSKAENMQK